MDELRISQEDLADMLCIGQVSSDAPDKAGWTDLSIYFRAGYQRPYVGVVRGMTREDPLRPDGLLLPYPRCFSFKFVCAGTLDRVINWFDDSQLSWTLRTSVDGWQPPKGTRLSPLGFTGKSFTDAARWLYPEGLSDNAVSLMMERDFAVKARSVRNQLQADREDKPPAPWVPPFLAALRWFDRRSWHETLPPLAERKPA